ncbi:MAG: hypothetical protein ACXVRP_13710 [Solirubrobacteraceae bacterium]
MTAIEAALASAPEELKV